MTWQKNTLFTTNPSVEVTTQTTDTWAVDFTAALKVGESVASAAISLIQIDPPTYATVAGFAGTATVESNVATFSVSGTVLTRGRTYLMRSAATLNTGKVVVLLTAVICVDA